MTKLASYFKWRSVTFWAGALLIASGVLDAASVEIPYISGAGRALLDALFNTIDPGTRISVGLGLVGLRRALDDVRG